MSTPSNSAAARAAVPRAQRPVLSSPSTTMPRPSPSTIHHTPCAAPVNAVPPWARAGPTIVPEIATPRAVPVCRPAEASEAATPAIERGIPETAELVIGGLTVPRKTPNSTIDREHGRQRGGRPEPERRAAAQRQRGPGDHQRQPGAAPADQPAGERGQHHDQHPDREQAQPGRERRQAAHVLQVQGGHEQERAERAQGQSAIRIAALNGTLRNRRSSSSGSARRGS